MNDLKQKKKFAKKHQKGWGAFIKPNAGNVAKGVEIFNHNMTTNNTAGEGSATGMAENLNKEFYEIQKLADKINVSGPQYREAPYPPFDELAINISYIPDNMRFKEWDCWAEDDNTIKFFWKTQEPFNSDDVEDFIKELKRALTAITEDSKYSEPFIVKLNIVARDGSEYGNYSGQVEINSKELKECNKMNIREELNKLDMEDYKDLVNMYESVDLQFEDKKKLAEMLSEESIDSDRLYRFLESKLNCDWRVWGDEEVDNSNALNSIAIKIKELFDEAGDVFYDDIVYDIFDYGSEILISNVLDPDDIGNYIEDELGFPFRVEDRNGDHGDLYIDTTQEYEDADGYVNTRVSREYLNQDNSDEDEDLDEAVSKNNICSICGEKIVGYGNNAAPVNNGICCDTCNKEVVIPARLFQMKNNKKLSEEIESVNEFKSKLQKLKNIKQEAKEGIEAQHDPDSDISEIDNDIADIDKVLDFISSNSPASVSDIKDFINTNKLTSVLTEVNLVDKL